MQLRTVADQRQRLLTLIAERGKVEQVALVDAFEKVLATDACAEVAVPAFDNSAMDGFALRAEDLANGPTDLLVVGEVFAGQAATVSARPGQAVAVATGAPIPPGADAVVPFELTHREGDLLHVTSDSAPGRHIRRRAEDLAVGDLILEKGSWLSARAQSALAAAGIRSIPVFAQVRAAVISTGDELSGDERLHDGQIPESNSVLLAGLLREAGAHVVSVRTVRDDAEAFEAALAEASGVDVVVCSGGAGRGPRDVVHAVLGERLDFAQVAMQPGRPQGFGLLANGCLVFSLPGNPLAAAAVFEALVRPGVLALAGRRHVLRRIVAARAASSWDGPEDREQWVPVRWSDDGTAVEPVSTRRGGSHFASSMARLEAWAVVPLGRGRVDAGSWVDVLVLA